MEDLQINIPKKMEEFVVIGLGRFGKSLALNLANLGKQVLAIDTDTQQVNSIQESVTSAVVADTTNPEVLRTLGAQNFDCAIVCIGDNIEASVLTTQTCKDLNIPYIIAKAQNEQHRKLLESIGADLVVFPEVFMSKKLANALSNPVINEAISVTDSFKICEIKCPNAWSGKSLVKKIRKKFKVTVIVIKRGDEVIYPEDETVLEENDTLIIAGEQNKIDSITSKISNPVDFANSFADAFNEE